MKGSCLCGSVTYEVDPPSKTFQYCHCSRCRKLTGSAHSANLFVPPEQFRWLGGAELVSHYDLPQAKYFTTSFCSRCGSTLPWTVKGGKTIVVPAGTLDEMPDILPQRNIFWGSRAPWLVETCELERFETIPGKS